MKRILLCIFVLFPVFAFAQGESGNTSRSSIPAELLRPQRGEALRYPVDTVIGTLGRGEASEAAYSYARGIASGILSGNSNLMMEDYMDVLEEVVPVSFRLGGGREEPDGSVSFLVRFLGSEKGVTGELYIRYVTTQIEEVVESAIVEEVIEINIEEVAEIETSDTSSISDIKAAIMSNVNEINNNVENDANLDNDIESEENVEIAANEVQRNVIVRTIANWTFEELIFEEVRSRQEEIRDSIQRFDFSPYERFY